TNLQSGIFAESQVLMWEDQEELQELKDEYYARHPPASPEARCLLDQIVLCKWHLRRFSWVEDSLWDQFLTASPQDSDACAYTLRQDDQTCTRLQHRINSTRRAFRLEARDQDAVVVSPEPVSPEPHSLEGARHESGAAAVTWGRLAACAAVGNAAIPCKRGS